MGTRGQGGEDLMTPIVLDRVVQGRLEQVTGTPLLSPGLCRAVHPGRDHRRREIDQQGTFELKAEVLAVQIHRGGRDGLPAPVGPALDNPLDVFAHLISLPARRASCVPEHWYEMARSGPI